jgi:predicted ATPase/predicted Ser/Thr protein kinase
MLAPGAWLQERYQIVAPIGRGGVGAVYQAADSRLGHTVAIKEILHRDTALRTAFEREARLLAALRHPTLPKVTDHFVEQAGQFLVMEFIPGEDLGALLLRQREALPVDDVLRWAGQLLDVLIYLHGQNPPVIHRDIKPQNLKLNERREVILLDFGLAKGAPGQPLSERSVAGYTLHYASPEQLRGEQTDARSDLYTLAATLYDLLSAVKPPDAARRLTTVAAGQSDPLLPLNMLNPAVPAGVAALVHQALALAPPARFADAATMRLALHATAGDTTEVLATATPVRLPAPPHNLPAQLTSLVGREAEVATVQQLLLAEHLRLVTLTGAGGIGKTRLALAIATGCLGHFQDGVYFVSLASIRESHLVLPTLAQTLGLREAPNTTVLQSLQQHLRDKELLLVLDNFEQVVAAAPLVSALLVTAPRLKVLITSREVLQIQGEQEFPVPALALTHLKQLPPPAELAQVAAIKLFVQRAQAVKPGFRIDDSNAAAVAAICKRLDGLPLAIELAAASTRVLPPQAILTRLAERFDLLHSGARDAPDRQRTLRASIAWSYDLLAAEEQALFRRLAVFAGSFDLAAAEVLGKGSGQLATFVLEGITGLIDKSLLRVLEPVGDEPRFSMLEMIREFGLRILAEEGEAESVRSAHAEYYFQLVWQAQRHFWGANIAQWVTRLESENDNLRATLDYLLSSADGAERSLLLAGSLWRFWEIRGYIVEGRTWLERALERRAEAPPSSRWLTLHGAGNLAADQGDYETAQSCYRESLHLLQDLLPGLEDPAAIRSTQRGIANSLTNLGHTALLQGDYAEAVRVTAEALSIHRQLDNQVGMAITINNLATINLHQSRYAQAEALSTESLALYRTLGDERGIGWNLHRLGTIARERGEYERASSYYQGCMALFERLSNQADRASLLFDLVELARQQDENEQAETHFQVGLTLARELGDKKEIANLLDRLSLIACRRGRYSPATTLNEESVALQREIGNRFGLSEALYGRGRIAFAQGRYDAAAHDYSESLQIKSQLGDQRGIVVLLKALALLLWAAGHSPERATRLFAASEKLRHAIGIVVPAAEQASEEEALAAMRTTLDPQTFALAWESGERLDVEQAVAHAHEEE